MDRDAVRIEIPGEPFAAQRPRATTIAGRPQIYDAPKYRSWKAYCRHWMLHALDGESLPIFPDGPLVLEAVLIHSCPRSQYRKRQPRERRWRDKRPDLTNCQKALEDAGIGIIYTDDRQVCRVHLTQITGAQGEAPKIVLRAYRPAGEPSMRPALDSLLSHYSRRQPGE